MDKQKIFHVRLTYSLKVKMCVSLFTWFYFSSVYKPYVEYFLLIPDDAVDRRKLRF